MIHLTPNVQYWITIGLFLIVFAGIFTEIVEKSLLAATGAIGVMLLGLLPKESAFSVIDFNTLSLLLGMMVTVSVAMEARVFEWISIVILRWTQGKPLLIFLLFMATTLVLSSVLNNVTTILVLLPLTISIARGIGINPKPLVLGEIFFANTGGLLTLIGDPVNTIVGSAAGLGMLDFLYAMWIPVLLHGLFVLVYLYARNHSQLRDIGAEFIKVFHNQLVILRVEKDFASRPFQARYAVTTSVILLLTIVGFLFSDVIGLSAAQIALCGAVLSLLFHHRSVDPEHIFAHVEWRTLVFFTGLFVVVGALEHTGILDAIARSIAVLAGNAYLLLGLLLVLTAVVSAFVDNIPFVTIMIPIIRTLNESQALSDPNVLWIALCLGAVMGGMVSPFGSSANIVAIATAAKSGYKISNRFYLRTSIPVSVMGILISYGYLITAYAV